MENSDTNISQALAAISSTGGEGFYIPVCDPQLKPHVGQYFETLDDGTAFYRKYALVSGFDVRLGSTRRDNRSDDFKFRYIFCNREGFKHSAPDDVEEKSKKRRTISNRVDCKARVVLHLKGAEFIEEHTHSLVPEEYRYMMKTNSNLSDGHRSFLIGFAKANIPPMKGYRMMTEIAGSHASVGCSKRQVKNFMRDLKAFVVGTDAQMIIDKLVKKRETCPGFYFEYELDKDDHLKSLFWADPISRRNSWIYGDAVTFDATYGTNTYSMIFAPFTSKDNHGKCVTLGAALTTGESHLSYEWVFRHFKKSMGREPTILMTGQDPAIKRAFPMVFTEARHRLCMWHIMMKLPIKVPGMKTNKKFMNEFCSLVWESGLEPHVFELRWKHVIDTFGLNENEWLTSMFEIRETWIPAYFRETRMGGIFRTSSASESENSFFQKHISDNSNLLQFFMHFDSALDSQRHTQGKLNNDDLTGCYTLRTKLPFEKHAASLYTRTILSNVQNEIEDACYVCRHMKTTVLESRSLYEFEDRINKGVFIVTYESVENNVVCTCQKFMMTGLLCSHIYYVFKDQNFAQIPEKYIVSRWTKRALSDIPQMLDNGVVCSSAKKDDNRYVVYEAISTFYKCLGYVEGNAEKIQLLVNVLRDTEKKFTQSGDNVPTSVRERLFIDYYGAPIPKDVVVKAPIPFKTKGSCSSTKAREQAAIEKSMKPGRKCSKCGEIGKHDARTCPNV